MSRIIERLIKYEEWENKYGELLRKQLNEGEEVVRCGECKAHHDANENPAHIMCGYMSDDDFCSYGEREGE